jgi:cell division protein FtsN
MKKIVFFILILSLTIVSCKTKKAATTDRDEMNPIEKISEEKSEAIDEGSELDNNAPIVVKTEEVSVAQDEDMTKEGFAFYVIMGSFSKPENAMKFKEQLTEKGFSPVVLNSETGFVRVAVDQSNSEQDARSTIIKIRHRFTEHSDVWLLKKK